MAKINVSPVTTFVLDGTPYSADQFGESQREAVPHVCVTAEGLDEGKVFGFSTEAGMEAWIAGTPYLDEYERLRAPGVAVIPPAEAKRALERFFERLARAGISPDDRDGIANFIVDYGRLHGLSGSTFFLFDELNDPSPMCVLDPGRHPDLGKCNNRASAVMATSFGVLFGRPDLLSPPSRVILVKEKLQKLAEMGFANRASSARVF